ncbi:MAG TPA: YqeG family HAD IIIA-type phosphatase [Gemmataceae bacterium]
MFRLVTPCLQLQTVLELEAAYLRARGITALLLDVDCTLKDFRAAEFHPEIVEWVAALRGAGLRLCLVSNGRPRRIAALAAVLGVEYVAKAFKPMPFGCKAALRKLGVPAREAAIVGDQIFADVLAGRLAGVAAAVLVRPTSPEEPWFTRLKRPLERWVLRRINRRRAAAPVPPPPEVAATAAPEPAATAAENAV